MKAKKILKKNQNFSVFQLNFDKIEDIDNKKNAKFIQ